MPRKPKQEKHKGVFEKTKGSGIWWIRYTDAFGKRRSVSVGAFSSACKLYDQYTTEIRLGMLQTPANRRGTKFSEVAEIGIAFSNDNHADASDFKQRVSLALEEFGNRVADSITHVEMQTWIDRTAHEREWAGATKNRVKASLSTAFREAIRAGRISSNPMKLVRRAKENPGKLRFLSQEEESRLRASIADLPNCLAQVDLALYTGVRKSEQFKATWSQVDFEHKHLYLPKTKNGEERYVHLNSAALHALQNLRQERDRFGLPEAGTLCVSQKEKAILNPRKWFTNALKRAGIEDVTWHTLRHTFASRLVMAGVDLKTVQELMGHKSIAMTARYAHLATTHKLSALELLVPQGTVSVQSGTQNGYLTKNSVSSKKRVVKQVLNNQEVKALVSVSSS